MYIGVTNYLVRRTEQHKQHQAAGFTDKYNVTNLVYFEAHAEVISAIEREKKLKKWRRAWKISLIEQGNPSWRDLSDDF